MENKLLEFQKRIQAIKKDGKNPHFKNTYATLPQILSEVKPILSELGLTLMQPLTDNKVFSCIYEGEKILISSCLDIPSGLSPQQIGSAITYFRRYTLSSLLALEIEDDDGNAASNNTPKRALNLKTDVYTQAVDFIKGGGSIDAITAKYYLSSEVETQLRKDGGI
jgi:hypothetical protein